VWKKEDSKPQGATEISTTSLSEPVSSGAAACISQRIRIKGEISGTEDLYVDGILEGKLDVSGASVTIGPNGKIKADIVAREIVVHGSVDGKLTGRDRVQLLSTGRVVGEVQTERLAIEDGALLRGKVETGKPLGKGSEAASSAAASGGSAKAGSVAAGTAI
jgi:cytoskeletal protein CcmA (bactofilin family)